MLRLTTGWQREERREREEKERKSEWLKTEEKDRGALPGWERPITEALIDSWEQLERNRWVGTL